MKSKFLLPFAILFVAAILLSGCADSDSPDTGGTSGGTTTPATPKTEITASGIGTTMSIAPSQDSTISGVVTITATSVPSETGVMGFSIQGGNVPPDSSNMNISLDTDGSDGWAAFFDTTQYGNGPYTIAVVAGSADFQRMLGSASADVVIQN